MSRRSTQIYLVMYEDIEVPTGGSVFCLTTCSELLDLCAPETINDIDYIVVVILMFSSSLVLLSDQLVLLFRF
jgi:hypothetical protein